MQPDYITDLPTSEQSSEQEIKQAMMYFGTPTSKPLAPLETKTEQKPVDGSSIVTYAEVKPYVISGVLFFLISTPFITDLVRDNVPYARHSDIAFLGLKTLMFLIALYITLHFKDAKM